MDGRLGTGATVAVLVVALAGCGGRTQAETPVQQAKLPPATSSAPTTTTPPPPPELPMGGRTVFPQYRVVAYYGTGGTPALGVLGQGTPEEAAEAIDKAAQGFATPDRKVQPAMEFIATVADGYPGPDGAYSHQVAKEKVQEYLDVARKHHQLFLLDVQPGQKDFMQAVQPYQDLLAQPDVGLALDAEWRMEPGQVPGKVIGHVGAAEVNGVLDWVAELTKSRDLPQKVVLLHMFRASMIPDLTGVAEHPELALVQHLDGFGGVETKMDIYHAIAQPGRFHMGFKLFYQQDKPMLGPEEVLRMTPLPEFVSYQ
ncbi:hypothetical protein [Kutzneria sp. 744]|uniref:hypothetical protein n=1 Tax=Kutzneria sp. (strain 744) TaxID=345341 RepID=UPI0003EEC712|nr:hypothetical protein [Kutzneria sp. 744]EWM19603.1 hypothetical protein KUTG_09907 [Kutzneria sp. 744]